MRPEGEQLLDGTLWPEFIHLVAIEILELLDDVRDE
jgi:hypothetical protein